MSELTDKRVEELAGEGWPAYARELAVELLSARQRIENANLAASETQSSDRNRVVKIMAALGYDYGDLDP